MLVGEWAYEAGGERRARRGQLDAPSEYCSPAHPPPVPAGVYSLRVTSNGAPKDHAAVLPYVATGPPR